MNADRVFVGTVNGGVWRTTNATAFSPNWTPLTDQFPNLSIGAIAISPLNTDHVFVGLGKVSSFGFVGGRAAGVLRTLDGGNTWVLRGQTAFAGLDVRSIVPTQMVTPTGQVILAAASGGGLGGIFRSDDGGETWQRVRTGIGSPGLPGRDPSHLVADPSDKDRFYAAFPGAFPGSGVFRSDNTEAKDWDSVNSGLTAIGTTSRIELSVHHSAAANVVYAALMTADPPPNAGKIRLAGIFRSEDWGETWKAMDLPGTVEQVEADPARLNDRIDNDRDGSIDNPGELTSVFIGLNPGAQANSHFSILADRDNPKVVFVGGDRQPSGSEDLLGVTASGAVKSSGRLFRGDFSQSKGEQWEPIVGFFADPDHYSGETVLAPSGSAIPLPNVNGPLPGTVPHADSRDMVFDAKGNILESDDGGIYRLVNHPNALPADPPPFEIDPPAFVFDPPPFFIDPPAFSFDPPAVDVDPPPFLTIDPPPFQYDPPVQTVRPPRVLVDLGPMVIDPPAVVIDPSSWVFDLPPFTFSPPPWEFEVPEFEYDPPAFDLDPPPYLGIDPPPFRYDPPAVWINPPAIKIRPGPIVLDPPPVAFNLSTWALDPPALVFDLPAAEIDWPAFSFDLPPFDIDPPVYVGIDPPAFPFDPPAVAVDPPSFSADPPPLALEPPPFTFDLSRYPLRRHWVSVNGNLRPTEFLSVAYDSRNNIIIGGTQDNGAIEQPAAGASTWTTDQKVFDLITKVGDGNTQAVDALGTNVVRYSMTNNFGGFLRREFNDSNQPIGPPAEVLLAAAPSRPKDPLVKYSGLDPADRPEESGFTNFEIVPYATNAVAPGRLLLGRTDVYESMNQGDILTSVLQFATPARVTALAYGGRLDGVANPDVAYVGLDVTTTQGNVRSELYLRTTSGGAFRPVRTAQGFVSYPGSTVGDIVLDPDDHRRAYVIDAGNVFRTTDGGRSFENLTGNLAALTADLRTIELFTPTANPGDDVLLVGAQGGVYRAILAGTEPVWAKLGANLPNAVVSDIHYDAADDLLLVGTLGRGAWTVPNARSALMAESVLTINGDSLFRGQDDTIRLVLDANNPLLLNVFDNNDTATPDLTVPLGSLSRIIVNGLNGNDTLIVDGSNGLPIPVNGVAFNGGKQTKLGDSLIFTGAGTETAFFTQEDPKSGQGVFRMGDQVLSFTGAEETTAGRLAALTDTTPFSADVLSIDTLAPGQNRVTGKSDSTRLVPLTFFDVKSFTLDTASNDGAAPADTITIEPAGMVASGLHRFTVQTGAGADRLNVLSDFSLAGVPSSLLGGDQPSFTYDGGTETDTIAADLDANFVLIDGSLSSLGGVIELVNLAGENADLRGFTGDNHFTVFEWTGTADINGGGGTDTLSILGSSVTDTITVAHPTVTMNAGTIRYQRIKNLEVDARDGADSIRVTATGGGVSTTILAGEQNDTIRVTLGAFSGVLLPIYAHTVVNLTVNGGGGTSDTLILDDRADLDRVWVVCPDEGGALPRLPGDSKALNALVAQHQARLVVLDPLMAFLDASVLTSSDPSVRTALLPLVHLAREHTCLVQMVRHLNKQLGRRALYRGSGSIGLGGTCRSAWLVAADPEAPQQRRVLAQLKNNLGPPQPSLAFELRAREAGPPDLVWLGESKWTADELVGAGRRAPQAAPRERARLFLEAFLKDGPRSAAEIWEAAVREGLSKRTLDRARKELSIRSEWVPEGRGARTYWVLEGQAGPQPPETSLEPWLRPLREKYPPRTPLEEDD